MSQIFQNSLLLIALTIARFMTFSCATDLSVDLQWIAVLCATILATRRIAILGLFLSEIIAILLIGPRCEVSVMGHNAWILEGLALAGTVVSIFCVDFIERHQLIGMRLGVMLLLVLFALCLYSFKCDSDRPFLGIYMAGVAIVILLTATSGRRANVTWSLLGGWMTGYFVWFLTLWIADIDLNSAGSLCHYFQRFLLIPLSVYLLGILIASTVIVSIRRHQESRTTINQ